jgi:hypothetical protein
MRPTCCQHSEDIGRRYVWAAKSHFPRVIIKESRSVSRDLMQPPSTQAQNCYSWAQYVLLDHNIFIFLKGFSASQCRRKDCGREWELETWELFGCIAPRLSQNHRQTCDMPNKHATLTNEIKIMSMTSLSNIWILFELWRHWLWRGDPAMEFD